MIDDGRRYLERTPQQYDAIIIDPPPPVPAAGSSLLYSRDFYELAKQRLRPGGILQQWLPPKATLRTRPRSRAPSRTSFPYVRVYGSVFGIRTSLSGQHEPDPGAQRPENWWRECPRRCRGHDGVGTGELRRCSSFVSCCPTRSPRQN